MYIYKSRLYAESDCLETSVVSYIFLIFFPPFQYIRAEISEWGFYTSTRAIQIDVPSLLFLSFSRRDTKYAAYRSLRRFISGLARVSLVSKAVQYNTEKQLRRARDNRMNEPETCVCFVFFFLLLLALRKADHSRDKHRFTVIEFVCFFLRC